MSYDRGNTDSTGLSGDDTFSGRDPNNDKYGADATNTESTFTSERNTSDRRDRDASDDTYGSARDTSDSYGSTGARGTSDTYGSGRGTSDTYGSSTTRDTTSDTYDSSRRTGDTSDFTGSETFGTSGRTPTYDKDDTTRGNEATTGAYTGGSTNANRSSDPYAEDSFGTGADTGLGSEAARIGSTHDPELQPDRVTSGNDYSSSTTAGTRGNDYSTTSTTTGGNDYTSGTRGTSDTYGSSDTYNTSSTTSRSKADTGDHVGSEFFGTSGNKPTYDHAEGDGTTSRPVAGTSSNRGPDYNDSADTTAGNYNDDSSSGGKSGSTMGKLQEKIGHLIKNEKMEQKGREKQGLDDPTY